MKEGVSPRLDRRWTSEEGAAMVAEWRKSGLSASAFVRDRGFGLHKLRYWSTRTHGAGPKRADFVVVPFEQQSLHAEEYGADADDVAMIEIFTGQDVVVRIPVNADPITVTATLKAVLEGSR